jgi:hypothetical protein
MITILFMAAMLTLLRVRMIPTPLSLMGIALARDCRPRPTLQFQNCKLCSYQVAQAANLWVGRAASLSIHHRPPKPFILSPGTIRKL